ncbi:S1 family peptidase [Corynebacterium pacaense]|uniref:S1 family peptidase n=1 Tax=Corynebacterium pacaense TaxID=1816684 RepID=UPI0009BB57FB|nr:trypsin-like serine protease [Corynebacterium pacaense]
MLSSPTSPGRPKSAARIGVAVLAATAATAGSVTLGAQLPANAMADARNVSPDVRANSLVRMTIGNMNCTGTLIAPQWVLTARHCIGEGTHSELTIGGLRIGETFRGTEAILHPAADLALIRLDHPSGAQVAGLSGTNLQPGTTGNSVGWGGWNRLNQFVAQQGDATIVRRVVNVPSPDPGAQLLEAGVTGGRLIPGDSGGPLFVNGQLAGVLSMSTDTTNESRNGTMGWYVPVAEHLDWIGRQTGIPVPAATGAPSQLVDATAYPSQIPPVQVLNIPATGSSLIDGSLRSLILGSS